MARVQQIISGVVISTLWGGASFAQSFSAEPIAFDLDSTADAGGTPVLIAAYQPPTDTSPSFASATTDTSAVITDTGLPSPSIILGRVEPGREADYGITTLLPDTVAEVGFAFDDLETRVAMRDSDPDMFRMLIEQGHIDPPENQLNAALQTELRRMNCYRSSIDGLWGRGSARSVGEYFDAREDGQDWPEPEPSVELFRTIISVPDVTCEVQQAAPARTTAARPAAPRPAATTTRRAPAPAPAAPKPAAKKPRISSGGGIGVFR